MDLNSQIQELVLRLEALAKSLFSKDKEFEKKILNTGCYGGSDYVCTYIGGGRLLNWMAFEPGLYFYCDDPSDGYSLRSSEKINAKRLIEIFEEYPEQSQDMKNQFLSAAHRLLE